MEINGEKLCIVAILFDSGKIDNCFYGEHVFENRISGKEVSKNGNKIVVSSRDIFSKEMYNDISSFIIRDEFCSIEKENNRYKDIIYGVLLEDISFFWWLGLWRKQNLFSTRQSNYIKEISQLNIEDEKSDCDKVYRK